MSFAFHVCLLFMKLPSKACATTARIDFSLILQVVVVDQSGSMRKTDTSDGATRSDAVWLTLAVDFVASQLTKGASKSSDVVSVISMRDNSSILIDRWPTDWILFNELIRLLRSSEPVSAGNYLPALKLAESLLRANMRGSCALVLLLLSDGKPSDHVPKTRYEQATTTSPLGIFASSWQINRQKHLSMFCREIEQLASKIGRRLNVLTIGFGDATQDFEVLKAIAHKASEYGCPGGFKVSALVVHVETDAGLLTSECTRRVSFSSRNIWLLVLRGSG
jgi:hypothetical protein